MSLLLSCQAISKSYGPRELFSGLTFTVHEGDKIGMIGPNGSGKSTLMKILAGLEIPDSGERALSKFKVLGYVEQLSQFPADKSVESLVLEEINDPKLEEYEKITRANIVLSKVGFEDPTQKAGILSGGWKKRLAIARQLAKEPDLLLLDEPTNHLDLEGILWLEDFLQNAPFAFIVVTHDRYFLEKVANRIIELNPRYPKGLFEVKGNYSTFLEKREQFFHAQRQLQESLQVKVRREVEWLRRGPKARTTKARYRIEEAGRLMQELDDVKARNNANRQTDIDFTASKRKTKELLVAKNIAKTMGKKRLFHSLSFMLSPKIRLGLVGSNGSGKTTLIRLLTGELEPDEGTIKRAEHLKIVHFEQEREHLDQRQTLRKALAPDGDQVVYRGRPIHVMSWARRFLFKDEQLDMQIGLLSGGEQARIHIARLMLQPADLLILDEPTNDLDLPTLEILEENLLEFEGAIVLVTHDRYLLDRVSTVLLGLDDDGHADFYADFFQWLEQRKERRKKKRQEPKTPPPTTSPKKKKLSYWEKKEWDEIEMKILEAEELLEKRQKALEDPEIASNPQKLQECYQLAEEAQANVDKLYARWAELEEKLL